MTAGISRMQRRVKAVVIKSDCTLYRWLSRGSRTFCTKTTALFSCFIVGDFGEEVFWCGMRIWCGGVDEVLHLRFCSGIRILGWSQRGGGRSGAFSGEPVLHGRCRRSAAGDHRWLVLHGVGMPVFPVSPIRRRRPHMSVVNCA